MSQEQHHGTHNPLGPDGLCRNCQYRRAELSARNRLLAVQTVLVAGLPVAMLIGEVTGRFKLTAEWVGLYIGGVIMLTATAFRMKLPRPGSNGNTSDS